MILKRTASALMAAVLAFGALLLPAGAQDTKNPLVSAASVSSEYQAAASTPDAPKANMNSGSYTTGGFKITLSGSSYNDEIWYSLNGTGYRRYTEPLSITKNTVIKAYLVRNNRMSEIVTYTYNVIPIVSPNISSGTYNGIQRIFLNYDATNTKVYYTLDGSTPDERSNVYSQSSGILIGTTSTLKLVAVRSGWTRYVRSYTYTINNGRDISQDIDPDGGLTVENTAISSVSLLDNYAQKWSYNQLSAAQKQAYQMLFEAVKSKTYQIDVSKLNLKADDFEKAYWAFDYDNPQFLALGNGYTYYYYVSTGYLQKVTITCGRTDSQIAAIQQTFNANVKKVVDTAKNQLTDYAKLKYIHDWIVNNTDYMSSGPAYKSEADGAVVYGKALCEGYSKAFMYLAQMLGFECICVVGNANGTAHMWNMVKLGGVWYHVDATFDDPIMSNGSKTLRHDYFLISTSAISKTHTINNPVSIPTAARSYLS